MKKSQWPRAPFTVYKLTDPLDTWMGHRFGTTDSEGMPAGLFGTRTAAAKHAREMSERHTAKAAR
jgi:hypothetical protein